MSPLRISCWLILALLGVQAASANAAEKKKPETTDNRQGEAQIRVWKGDFGSKRAVHVSCRAQGRKGAVVQLVESAQGFHAGEYAPVAAGPCMIEVTGIEDSKERLASISAQLAPESFSTLLLQERGGTISAELIDDRVFPNTCELLVRNFLPDIASLQFDAAPDFHLKLSSPEAFFQIRGLPRKKFEIETSGTEASGKTFRWSNEVDFTQYRRATLLLQPDAYGRIRLRLMIDGQFASGSGAKLPPAPK